MSLEVLRLMENGKIHDYSCFSNKGLIFSSEQNNQNDGFKFTSEEQRDLDRMLEIKFNSKKGEDFQVKCNDKKQSSFKFCSEIQPSLKKNSILCPKRKYSEVALSVFKNGAYFGSNLVFNILMWIIDFIINLCHNESIRDILMVILAISIEVFVMLVFSVSTILATVIVKIDEAFRKHRNESKNVSKRLLRDTDERPKISTIAKVKSRRSRKHSSKNSIEHIFSDNTTEIQIYKKLNTKSKTSFDSNKCSLPSVNDLGLEISECGFKRSAVKIKNISDYLPKHNETQTYGDSITNENNKTCLSQHCEDHKETEVKDDMEKEQNQKRLCPCKEEDKNAKSNSGILSFGINELNETFEVKQ
ncbi:hypothetical protein ILUMI_13448 [Ignelater luminosus]|uniref:Uncharacterized protein n=1 Tax=Ignelater luminosus TaxID=2038154 RepID=A0A8K0G5T6_IGNLU|nr:hypothetical protein ILUMI_13448 [Ignelater luminosus]